MMKRCISLYILLVWSLSSTAWSFQSSAGPSSKKPSSSSTTTSTSTIHNKDLTCTPLQVSATTSSTTTGARRLFQDWTSSGKSSSSSSSNNNSNKNKKSNKKKSVYEPSPINYQRAKEEWADRYTNLDSLRATFGANKNKVWGDLDPATARRLYKTLLPKALLELVKVGVQPEDLAPLAYQARVAAKLYARERCHVPARVFCQLFDGFRQWKKYGKFQTCGMSYDQVWEKYQEQLHFSEQQQQQQDDDDDDYLTEEDVTAKICLKILERSCVTNEGVDKWVLAAAATLPPDDPEQREDLVQITQTLENDVRKLLRDGMAESNGVATKEQHSSPPHVLSLRKYRTLRMVARARRRAAGHHNNKKQQQEQEQQPHLEVEAVQEQQKELQSTTR